MQAVKIIFEGDFTLSNINGEFTLTVNPAPPPPNPLVLNPASGALPPETEGVAVAGDLVTNASGGVQPYSLSASGTIPAGMGLKQNPNPDGSVDIVITGTPDAGDAGNYDFTVTVTDSSTGPSGAQTKSLRISR